MRAAFALLERTPQRCDGHRTIVINDMAVTEEPTGGQLAKAPGFAVEIGSLS